MVKIRYEIETGKVNLISNGGEVVAVDGHEIIELDTAPQFDDATEHLYVKNGQVVAVKVEEGE